jgi:hypothetical protein
MYITDKQNKGLFVFDTVFAIIWITLSGSPDNGPDKESIENVGKNIFCSYRKDFGSKLYSFPWKNYSFLGLVFFSLF